MRTFVQLYVRRRPVGHLWPPLISQGFSPKAAKGGQDGQLTPSHTITIHLCASRERASVIDSHLKEGTVLRRELAAPHARRSSTTSARVTTVSVRLSSRPSCGNVSFVWSRPSAWRSVACRCETRTTFSVDA